MWKQTFSSGFYKNLKVAHRLCDVHLKDKQEGKSLMPNLKRMVRLAEPGREDRRRRRGDERSKPKLGALKPRSLQRFLVCIRHTVTDLSKYFFLTCPPPQLLALAAGLISVDGAKTTSVRLQSSVWYAPGGLWCLITFSVWGPVHLSSGIRHIASPSCPAHSSFQPWK